MNDYFDYARVSCEEVWAFEEERADALAFDQEQLPTPEMTASERSAAGYPDPDSTDWGTPIPDWAFF